MVQRLRDDGMTIIPDHIVCVCVAERREADDPPDRIVVIDHGAVISKARPGKLKELVGGSVCEISVGGADHARVVRAQNPGGRSHTRRTR